MTFSQVLLWTGMAIAATQFFYARRLDQSLPAAEKLPSWGLYGPDMLQRRVALYMYSWLQLLLTVLLFLPTVFDASPGAQDITIKKLALFCLILMVMPLSQAIQALGLLRWIREAQPQIRPPVYVKWAFDPKTIFGFVTCCFVLGYMIFPSIERLVQ